jgi:hypothetical protein
MKKKELKKQIRDCKKDIQKLIGYSLDKVKIIKSLKQELETLRSANHDMHRQLVEAGKRTDEIKGSNPDDNLQYQLNAIQEMHDSTMRHNYSLLMENNELKCEHDWDFYKNTPLLCLPPKFKAKCKKCEKIEYFTQEQVIEIENKQSKNPTALQALEELRGLDNEKKIVKNRRKESISERKARHQAILDGIVPFEELRGIEPSEPVKGVLDNHSPKRLAEILGLDSTGQELETKKSPEHNPEDLSINNKP